MEPAKPPRAVPAGSARLRDLGMGVLLLGVLLLVYLPALQGGFLWDDDGHVTAPELRSWHGLWRIWFEVGATQQYYPFLHSAFWVEHRLWGDAVLGYHLVNLVLHAGAACLVVAIMRRLALPGAWLAGFIFALHPVGVESVAWITEQKNTLSTVCYLGAGLAYLRFDQERRWSRYWPALGLFGLALLSKTVTATLPAALLVVGWWRRGRLEWKRDVAPLLPWLVLGAAGGLVSAWVERKYIGAEGTDFALTLVQRGLLAGRVIWFYLGKLVWPADLMFIYPRWTVDSAAGWQYLFPLGVLALVAGLWRVARRHRGPLAGLLFFAGTLFPVLGFFNVYPFLFSYVADHFQYLASLGVIVPLAAGLALAAGRLPGAVRRLAPGLGVVLLAVLGALSWRQSRMYGDSATLYRETLARNPACWMAHYNLGDALMKMPGRRPEAISHFEAALRSKPAFAKAYDSLGIALAETPGRLPEALVCFEAALRIKPDFALAHYNLGNALLNIPERRPDAIAHYEAALRIEPEYAQAHYNLANTLAETPGRLPDAIAHYEAALRIKPDYAEAHNNLGIALKNIPERLPEAIAHYEAALRLKPDYALAHYNLGNALLRIPGRVPEAMAHYEAALQIKPDFEQARQMLDRLQAAQR